MTADLLRQAADAKDAWCDRIEALADAATPNHVYRGLAETLIKQTRWNEWVHHGLRWQHERITEMAAVLERWFPDSELATRQVMYPDEAKRLVAEGRALADWLRDVGGRGFLSVADEKARDHALDVARAILGGGHSVSRDEEQQHG